MIKNNKLSLIRDKKDESNNSSELFDNLDIENKLNEKNETKGGTSVPSLVENIFNRLEGVCLLLWGEYLNEEDVARLFRLPDPCGKGKNTIRNYALRSKKLPYAKAGRHGLLFHRKDCDKLFSALRSESLNDFFN